jgi:hypothetical protein
MLTGHLVQRLSSGSMRSRNLLSVTQSTGNIMKLNSSLKIEPQPRGGWQLILWVGQAFNYTTPFRAMLSEIAEALGPASVVQLPPYEAGEDFVEGTLQFGRTTLRVYYEHSLGSCADAR